MWQTQIQTIELAIIIDAIQEVLLILYYSTPSDLNFQTFLMPKINLAEVLSQKAGPLGGLEPFLSF